MPGNIGGAVELDVGGTTFKAAKSTLCLYSAYFRSLFENWQENDDDDAGGPIFIDQDAAPFRELLTFMRNGGVIQVEKLTIDVMLLAEYLGIEQLLAAIKCIAYRNQHPEFEGSDEEAIASFPTIQEAVTTGLLPGAITTKVQGPKEYCSIFIYNKDAYKFVPAPNENPSMFMDFELVSFVCKRSMIVNDRLVYENVENCPTLLDCLNWISKNGYRTYEKDMVNNQSNHACWKTLTFSRTAWTTLPTRPTSALSTVIIDPDHDKDPLLLPEKKYALVIPGLADQSLGVYIKADVMGQQEQLHILTEEDAFPDHVPQQIVQQTTSHISLEGGESMDDAMGWLQKEGYTEREKDLEEIYEELLSYSPDPFVGGKLQLYSKRLYFG